MEKTTEIIRNFNWLEFRDPEAWELWRATKIRTAEILANSAPIALDSLSNPTEAALREVENRAALTNFALYNVRQKPASVAEASDALARFAARLGFGRIEAHRSAGRAKVVALRTSSEESKRGYIPYTQRAMGWHTDGYYNAPDARVQGFILQCHQPAADGGENQFIDPEIAYLRLRDENPSYLRALMHPEAMLIPENREADGSLRPVSVGPVFYPDPTTGRLQMRYTARTRSIEWRDDLVTRKAADWLRDWLSGGDPLMVTLRLGAGQGVVSNNILHNRTGFHDSPGSTGASRVMLRVRFHERVAEALHGAA